MSANILYRQRISQGGKRLNLYDKDDPSITGKSRRYINSSKDGKALILTGTKENQIDWVSAVDRKNLSLLREQILQQVFCTSEEIRPLDAYKEQNAEWMKEKQIQLSSGKTLHWSQEKAEIPVGEGLLNFLYADFETIAKTLQADHNDRRYYLKNRRNANTEVRTLYDFLCFSETLRYFEPLIGASIYTALFPPVMAARTRAHFQRYYHFLRETQKDLMELVEFVFDKEQYPEVLGKLTENQRYALFCRSKCIAPHFEYTCAFDSLDFEMDPEIAITLQRSGSTISKEKDGENTQLQEFEEKYRIHKETVDEYAQQPFYFFSRIQITNIPDMLVYEISQMLMHHVRLKKCKQCGKYFIVKGNYKGNCCSRIAEGETRTCQQMTAQQNQKNKVKDDVGEESYQRHYNRYTARVKSRQIKEDAFRQWQYQAVVNRDEYRAGKITFQEFDDWMEAYFPNRKKLKK